MDEHWTDWLDLSEAWWEDTANMGERPEGVMSNNPFMQQLWECMLRPLTDAEINTPVKSMGHAWQIPGNGILYIPENLP